MKRMMWIGMLMLGLACGVRGASAQEEASGDTLGPLVSLLKESDDPQFQLDILRGMNEALKGRTNIRMPAEWKAVSAKLAASPNAEVKSLTQSLSSLFGDEGTMGALKNIAADAKADPEARRRALASLMDAKAPAMAPLLQEWIHDPVLRAQALRGLAAYDDPNTPAAVLKAYPQFDAADKLNALTTLASREEYATKLLEALKRGSINRKDLTAATVRQLAQLNHQEINSWITENWGAVKTSSEEKLAEIARFKQMIAKPGIGREANPSTGRAVFARTCAQCHTLFGEGGKVGPDLTGSGRADPDYVLQNVVDPSAVVGRDYQMWVIREKPKGKQKQGRLINGIITREDENVVTVVTDTETIMLPRNQIERMKQSEISMMPEGLLQGLKEEEFLDLLAYLRSPNQVPLPPEAAAAGK